MVFLSLIVWEETDTFCVAGTTTPVLRNITASVLRSNTAKDENDEKDRAAR